MGLATIDPHSQKEDTEIHKIPKFGVNHLSGFPYISLSEAHPVFVNFFIFLNARISVKTSPINTKLGDSVNLGVLFLTMWINSTLLIP